MVFGSFHSHTLAARFGLVASAPAGPARSASTKAAEARDSSMARLAFLCTVNRAFYFVLAEPGPQRRFCERSVAVRERDFSLLRHCQEPARPPEQKAVPLAFARPCDRQDDSLDGAQ